MQETKTLDILSSISSLSLHIVIDNQDEGIDISRLLCTYSKHARSKHIIINRLLDSPNADVTNLLFGYIDGECLLVYLLQIPILNLVDNRLVGRFCWIEINKAETRSAIAVALGSCLLYTSDAADE